MREFLPSEKALRASLADAVRKNCLLYGFEQIRTPSIESWEVLSAKFAGGGREIILKALGLAQSHPGKNDNKLPGGKNAGGHRAWLERALPRTMIDDGLKVVRLKT